MFSVVLLSCAEGCPALQLSLDLPVSPVSFRVMRLCCLMWTYSGVLRLSVPYVISLFVSPVVSFALKSILSEICICELIHFLK